MSNATATMTATEFRATWRTTKALPFAERVTARQAAYGLDTKGMTEQAVAELLGIDLTDAKKAPKASVATEYPSSAKPATTASPVVTKQQPAERAATLADSDRAMYARIAELRALGIDMSAIESGIANREVIPNGNRANTTKAKAPKAAKAPATEPTPEPAPEPVATSATESDEVRRCLGTTKAGEPCAKAAMHIRPSGYCATHERQA